MLKVLAIISLILGVVYTLFFIHEKVKHGLFTGTEDEE